MFIDPMLDIAVASVIAASISQILQHKVMNRKKMKEQQKQMQEMQKKMNELVKKSDPKSENEMKKIQADMMTLMNDMMGGNLKYMAVSMVVFLPIFGFLGATYEKAVINLPFPMPWLGGDYFIMLYTQTNWLGWYFVCSLVMSFLFMGILSYIEKKDDATKVKK